jgi:translation initiation factor 2B subunit (eIF-2B alpha/beta/delta family)
MDRGFCGTHILYMLCAHSTIPFLVVCSFAKTYFLLNYLYIQQYKILQIYSLHSFLIVVIDFFIYV